MKRFLSVIVAFVVMLCFSLPMSSKAAIADGTYSINYQVNKPGSSSASMANDYFLKPAKLIVANGKMTVQLTIKKSSWVTEFNPPGGASVISRNDGADQRVVQFTVANANLTTIAMKIDIDDIDYHHSYSVDFLFDSAGLPEAKAPEQPQAQQKPAEPAKTNPSTNTNPTQSKPPAASDEATNTAVEQSKPVSTSSAVSVGQAATEPVADQEVPAEEQTEAAQSEQVENPETSDSLPMLYVLVLIIAAIVFVRTKKIKTN